MIASTSAFVNIPVPPMTFTTFLKMSFAGLSSHAGAPTVLTPFGFGPFLLIFRLPRLPSTSFSAVGFLFRPPDQPLIPGKMPPCGIHLVRKLT